MQVIWSSDIAAREALLSLASLITSQLDSKDPVHDSLRQTTAAACTVRRMGRAGTSMRLLELHRHAHQFREVLCANALHHPGAMILNGLRANAEHGADLLV